MTYSIAQAAEPDNLKTWLDFIAQIAWPFAVVSIVFILRKPIREILARLKNLKAFGVEADLGEKALIFANDVAIANEISPPEEASSEPKNNVDDIDPATPEAPENEKRPVRKRKARFYGSGYLGTGHLKGSLKGLNTATALDFTEVSNTLVISSWDSILKTIQDAAFKHLESSLSDWAQEANMLMHRNAISKNTLAMIIDAYDIVSGVLDGQNGISLSAAVGFMDTATIIKDRIGIEAGLD